MTTTYFNCVMLQVYNTFIIYNFNAQGVAISILILNIAVNLE